MKEHTKVLIVEGNGDYCSKCALALRTYGFETITAPRDGLAVTRVVGFLFQHRSAKCRSHHEARRM